VHKGEEYPESHNPEVACEILRSYLGKPAYAGFLITEDLLDTAVLLPVVLNGVEARPSSATAKRIDSDYLFPGAGRRDGAPGPGRPIALLVSREWLAGEESSGVSA
jgi:hypothetical protein